VDFDRRARSQPERTRREDRRLNFYELRDNLALGLIEALLESSQLVEPLLVVTHARHHFVGLVEGEAPTKLPFSLLPSPVVLLEAPVEQQWSDPAESAPDGLLEGGLV
jgi:hypothetical protein